MSTVVIGGGGPRPNARIVSIVEVDGSGIETYEIRDGREVCGECRTLAQATVLLPVIQRGE